MILPLEAHGVKVISMGFFVPEDTPVIWRGPMLHKAIEQFLGDVYWGDLDFLLCDLPPGTGDVSISLASFIPGASMVVVTTPQEAAHTVAQRAGKMAERTNLRPIGVIENMSWFVCPHCGERELLFGEGGGQLVADTIGVPLLAQVPLQPAMRVGSDTGMPIVVSEPSSPAAVALRESADAVRKAAKTKIGKPLTCDGALSAALKRSASVAVRPLRAPSSDPRPRWGRRPGPLRDRPDHPDDHDEDHHAERRPLRTGQRAEPLVDPQEVLEEPAAPVIAGEQQRRDPFTPRLLDEPPQDREQDPGEDHVVHRGLMDAHALLDDRAQLLVWTPLTTVTCCSVAPVFVRNSLYVPFCRSAGARQRADLAVHGGAKRAAVIGPCEQPRGGLAEVIADDQVADPTDRDPEGQRSDERVGHLEEPQPEPADVDRVRDRGAGDPAEQRDPALPDVDRLDRLRRELRPMREHVEEPRADDGADQRPQDDGVDRAIVDPAAGRDRARTARRRS